MRDDIFNGFYDKFDVKTRPGRGGTYAFVSADDVTDRMNKLFKGDWSSMVTFQDIIGDNVIVRVRIEVRDPGSGNVYFHEGYGGQANDASAEAGNVFKSAYSKAIVSACRRWGVGLFIEEGDQLTSTIETAIGPVTVPAAAPTVTGPAPGAPSLPPGAGPRSEEVKAPPVPQASPTPTSTPPAYMPSIPKAAGVPWNKPAEEQPPVVDIPKVPGPATAIPPTTEPAAAPAGVIDENRISDVQKISIESLVSMRGITYKEMAEGALQRVPDVGTLTHDEAVAVIQYGNYLYKKNKQK